MAVIDGTPASETLIGTAGNDTITGFGGDDLAKMGGGNDVFIWNPGDGNDRVEGGTGTDTVEFDGDAGAEAFTIGPNGGRVQLTRNVGDVVMDLNDVERIALQPLGGSDAIIVDDVTGTDLKQVAIDLAGAIPGKTDGALDTVYVNGSGASNIMTVTQAGGVIAVTGLAAEVTITHADTLDTLTLQGLGGNDKISAKGFAAGAMQLIVGGGVGNDVIVGGQGADILDGGDGNDTVTGAGGNDTTSLGKGDDLFIYSLGDGKDVVEGGEGVDTLRAVGTNGADAFSVFPQGAQAKLGLSVTMDDVEDVEIRALGGADEIAVHDLKGTGVTQVTVDLAATSGGTASDTALDLVELFCEATDDTLKIASAGGAVVAGGLGAQLSIFHADKTDALIVHGGDGNDTIDAGKLAANKLALELWAGDGNDTLIGSAGADKVRGEDGKDLAFLGAGNDLFQWVEGDGDDTVEGGSGTDRFTFSSGNNDETVEISAKGGRISLTDNLGAVAVDLNDIEQLTVHVFNGEDKFVVNDLAGTDVKLVALDVGIVPGEADLLADAIVVNGGNSNDKINVVSAGGSVSVTGLAAQVTVSDLDLKLDTVTINGLGGDDIITAKTDPTAVALPLVIDGGTGNDQITGGLDGEILYGGDGNDTIAGGGGDDVVLLGKDDDLLLWGLGDGSDNTLGGAGTDTVRVTGGTGADIFTILTEGAYVSLFTSDSAKLDIGQVERLEVRTLGGADKVLVSDLAETDVTEVVVDLAAAAGGTTADTKSDTVVVDAAFDGFMTVSVVGSKMLVNNGDYDVVVAHWGATDKLVLNGSAGDDHISAEFAPAGKMPLQLLGNDGDDVIDGGAGNDLVQGGADNDVLTGGAGNDELVGESGNDTITGGAGSDIIYYLDIVDGHDTVIGFDGNAAGGQDVFNLANLFSALSVPVGDRAARVSIVDKGASVEIAVDTNGDLTFDLAVATLKTADAVTIGQDIFVGT